MAESKRKRSGGGRRANYAPKATEVGLRKYLPVGWAYWTGFVLFGLLSLAMVAGAIGAAADAEYADIFGALLMGTLFTWMTYLFGISRFTEDF